MNNSKNALPLMLFFFCLLLTACKKKEKPDNPDDTSLKGKLKTELSPGSLLYTFNYDDKGLLTKKTTDLIKTGGVPFIKEAEVRDYQYENGKITTVKLSVKNTADAPLKLYLTERYQYQGEFITDFYETAEYEKPSSGMTPGHTKFSYNPLTGHLTGSTWTPETLKYPISSAIVHQYGTDSKGNLTSDKTTYYDTGGKISSILTLTATYDDKVNPHFKLGGFWDIFRFFAKNNYTEIFQVQSDGSSTVSNYRYEFDTEGRPVKVFRTLNNNTQLLREYTYY